MNSKNIGNTQTAKKYSDNKENTEEKSALQQLIYELKRGKISADQDGWISEKDILENLIGNEKHLLTN